MASMWSIGLINKDHKYLTEEQFGGKISTNGKSLKVNSVFSLEPFGGAQVVLRGNKGKVISCADDGKVECTKTDPTPDCGLTVEVFPDGRWAFKAKNGRYLGGVGDVDAYAKTAAEDRLWTVQLAMHPQVCIRNDSRRRFVHLKGNALTTDEDIPWGCDAVFTLNFIFKEKRYEIETTDGRFLSADGSLQPKSNPNCQFLLEFYGGQVAFRARDGKYLAALGKDGAIRANRSETPAKDELFSLSDSQPQFKFKSVSLGKFISISQPDNICANKTETTDLETFQLEIDPATKKWSFRTIKNEFVMATPDGSRLGCNPVRGATEWFTITWDGPQVNIQASNGKYIMVKPNGAVVATAAAPDISTGFIYEIVNRPNLCLRGEQGFLFTNDKGIIRCNGEEAEVFHMHVSAGNAKISLGNGVPWKVNDDAMIAPAHGSDDVFHFEFLEHGVAAIKYKGKYLQSSKTGELRFTGDKVDSSTLWEY
eukprot:m.54530 g.54530  ORF g.54530 m.54530 type:complete len:480 (-) comp13259_c0_seq1:401-1840(-)